LIAAGVAAAVVAAILAAALASYLASAGAEINFKTIVPEKNSAEWVPDLFQGTPTKVAVTWSVKSVKPGGIASAVKVLKTDTIEWHDSTIDTLDGKDIQPTKIKGDKEFVVESGKSDSSTINLKDKGYGIISTSFDAHVDQAVKDAGEGVGDALGSALEGLSGVGMGGFIMIILAIFIVVMVLPILIPMITSMFTKQSNNTKQ
jgi:ABC-type amino acid transport system permease subunit